MTRAHKPPTHPAIHPCRRGCCMRDDESPGADPVCGYYSSAPHSLPKAHGARRTHAKLWLRGFGPKRMGLWGRQIIWLHRECVLIKKLLIRLSAAAWGGRGWWRSEGGIRWCIFTCFSLRCVTPGASHFFQPPPMLIWINSLLQNVFFVCVCVSSYRKRAPQWVGGRPTAAWEMEYTRRTLYLPQSLFTPANCESSVTCFCNIVEWKSIALSATSGPEICSQWLVVGD